MERRIFLPVIEPDIEGAFITKSPRSLYKLGQVASIPFIFSMTSKELELGLGVITVINIFLNMHYMFKHVQMFFPHFMIF